jgi:probable addiction module antidote protein
MRRKKQRNVDYKADLFADLRRSADFAAEYLSAAKTDSRGAFLIALRDVVEARKGVAKTAIQAKVNRETLYRTLSEAGNPTLATLDSIWEVLGLEVGFKARQAKPRLKLPINAENVVVAAIAETTTTEVAEAIQVETKTEISSRAILGSGVCVGIATNAANNSLALAA